MDYFIADYTVYRRPRPGALFEVFLDGEWHLAAGELAPSEQDYDHMRPIDEAEALRLTVAPDKPTPTPASDRLIREMYRDDPVEGIYVLDDGRRVSGREMVASLAEKIRARRKM